MTIISKQKDILLLCAQTGNDILPDHERIYQRFVEFMVQSAAKNDNKFSFNVNYLHKKFGRRNVERWIPKLRRHYGLTIVESYVIGEKSRTYTLSKYTAEQLKNKANSVFYTGGLDFINDDMTIDNSKLPQNIKHDRDYNALAQTPRAFRALLKGLVETDMSHFQIATYIPTLREFARTCRLDTRQSVENVIDSIISGSLYDELTTAANLYNIKAGNRQIGFRKFTRDDAKNLLVRFVNSPKGTHIPNAQLLKAVLGNTVYDKFRNLAKTNNGLWKTSQNMERKVIEMALDIIRRSNQVDMTQVTRIHDALSHPESATDIVQEALRLACQTVLGVTLCLKTSVPTPKSKPHKEVYSTPRTSLYMYTTRLLSVFKTMFGGRNTFITNMHDTSWWE